MQSKGKVPVDKNLFKRLQRGAQIKSALVLSKNGVMLSGPQALIVSNAHNSVQALCGVI